MQKSNSEMIGRFSLPSGVATNSQELRALQRKLLQHHYQPAAPSKAAQPNEGQYQHREIEDYDSYTRQAIKKQKSALSQDLIDQMRTKSQIQQLSKRDGINQEHQLLQFNTRLDSLEREKQKRFNRQYAMEAQQDLKIKEMNKREEAKRSQMEKEMYRNRYSVGDLRQSYSEKNRYENPTQKYINEVDMALRNRETKVLNPQHLKNSSFKITRRADHLPNLDFMHKGTEHQSNYIQQNSFFKESKQRENQQKMELKATLLAQMRQKEEGRRMEKSKEFFNPYTSREFKEKHHPINNPVDYHIAHDNRYVMRQLGTLK